MPISSERKNAERRTSEDFHLGTLRGGRLDVERIPEPLKTINGLITSATVILGEALSRSRDSGQCPDLTAYVEIARAACIEARLNIVQTVVVRGGDQRLKKNGL